MKSAIVFLLILVSILPTKAAPAKDKKLTRVPFRRVPSKRPKISRFHGNASTTSEAGQTSDVITLASSHDFEWRGTISIGTPPQEFEALLDTGSGDSWVPDLTCKECAQLTLYNGDASKTFHDAQEQFEVLYDSGESIKGTWTRDDIALGADLTISQQAFGRANTIAHDFISWGSSGLIALGFSSVGSGTAPTLIENLLKNRLLDDTVFSCRFIKDSDQEGGEILFGGIETQYVKGDIQYTKTIAMNNQPTWNIPVADMQIAGRSLGHSANAYVDTGTSIICVSDAAASSLYSGISGAVQRPDGWFVQSPFPSDVAFVIGSRTFTIPAEDIVTSVKGDDDLLLAAIQGCGTPDSWLIGDTFIKNHYLVFDYGKNVIGIGERSDYQ